MEKRGLSGVVTTLMIVAVSVVAVGVLSVVVMDLLNIDTSISGGEYEISVRISDGVMYLTINEMDFFSAFTGMAISDLPDSLMVYVKDSSGSEKFSEEVSLDGKVEGTYEIELEDEDVFVGYKVSVSLVYGEGGSKSFQALKKKDGTALEYEIRAEDIEGEIIIYDGCDGISCSEDCDELFLSQEGGFGRGWVGAGQWSRGGDPSYCQNMEGNMVYHVDSERVTMEINGNGEIYRYICPSAFSLNRSVNEGDCYCERENGNCDFTLGERINFEHPYFTGVRGEISICEEHSDLFNEFFTELEDEVWDENSNNAEYECMYRGIPVSSPGDVQFDYYIEESGEDFMITRTEIVENGGNPGDSNCILVRDIKESIIEYACGCYHYSDGSSVSLDGSKVGIDLAKELASCSEKVMGDFAEKLKLKKIGEFGGEAYYEKISFEEGYKSYFTLDSLLMYKPILINSSNGSYLLVNNGFGNYVFLDSERKTFETDFDLEEGSHVFRDGIFENGNLNFYFYPEDGIFILQNLDYLSSLEDGVSLSPSDDCCDGEKQFPFHDVYGKGIKACTLKREEGICKNTFYLDCCDPPCASTLHECYKPYFPGKQVCCTKNPSDCTMSDGSNCEGCVRNKDVESGDDCCGGEGYFKDYAICCDGSIFDGDNACCGGEGFNNQREECCGGDIVDKPGMCCEGSWFKNAVGCCDGEGMYGGEVCCPQEDGSSSPKKGDVCCGSEGMHSDYEVCCPQPDGSLAKDEGDVCCNNGEGYFIPGQVCCPVYHCSDASPVYGVYDGDLCCGDGAYYGDEEKDCCSPLDSSHYSSESIIYDTSEKVCCHNTTGSPELKDIPIEGCPSCGCYQSGWNIKRNCTHNRFDNECTISDCLKDIMNNAEVQSKICELSGCGISSVCDGEHSAGSAHYTGNAFDIGCFEDREKLNDILDVIDSEYPGWVPDNQDDSGFDCKTGSDCCDIHGGDDYPYHIHCHCGL